MENVINITSNSNQTLEAKPVNKRIEWIDTAKFIAMFCVIFAHCSPGGDVISYLYSFHLPVFFLLNGMTLRIDGVDFGTFLVKKIKSYIIPMVCLSVLISFFAIYYNDIRGVRPTVDYFVNNFINIYQQVRYYAIWFLTALFLADIITFLLLKLVKCNLILSVPVFLIELALAISFNHFYQRWLTWNMDAAIFGVLFVYLGYVFMQKPLEKARHYIFLNRWISFGLSVVLLTVGFLLTKFLIIDKYHTHLEMWGGIYEPHYILLPVAIVLSFGVCFFSAAVTNKVLAQLGLTTLVLLAFHQEWTMKFFGRWFVSYRESINVYLATNPNDYHVLLYTLAETLFCVVWQVPLYYLIVYSPFAFILNKKMPRWYKDKFYLVKNKISGFAKSRSS